MGLHFAGAVLDVTVADLDRAEAFYSVLIGRPADLRPRPEQREWRLHRDPEVAFRMTFDPDSAGGGTLSVGVTDLAAERSRLAAHWPDLPHPLRKPGIITLLRLPDPDGNEVTLWQDLLGVAS